MSLFKNEKSNDDIYNEDEMASMKAQSTNPSNREALRDKIHEIHNYLRNNGAGYGMNALKIFNIIYCLKKIEDEKLFDKTDLSPECKFSYLLALANGDVSLLPDNEQKAVKGKEDEKLAEILYKNVLDSLSASKFRDYIFYEIPQHLKASTWAHLVKEINKITIIEKTCNVLLSGKIYEYFIGRDESAISELGAYFTDRHIVNFIIKRLDPKMTDGVIPSMVDMFGGSGGFTTGYVNYLNEKYDKKINWETQLRKIHHFDINDDVIKSAWLELFCLTNVMPYKEDVKAKNAFKDKFGTKYKYILTNPPYGGDKNSKSDVQSKRDKIKTYVKSLLIATENKVEEKQLQAQLKKIELEEKEERKQSEKSRVCLTSCSEELRIFANNLKQKLVGNDKEACSLILIMGLLDIGGTAIGVLKEGVFFNRTYKDLRKLLIEKYNVREVISVPQDQFENTSTKTSILIFDNTEEKTTEVKFSELVVEKYTKDKFEKINGEIYIVENAGDISGINEKLISTATKADILANANYSLNGKDYGKKELIVGERYDRVKLGDICEFLQKSKRKASFGQEKGQYNFYTSSDKVQRCDVADYKEECLIIGDGGVANIKIDNCFSCSDHNHIIKTKHNLYIYYLICGNITLLSDGFSGSVLKNLSKDYLLNLEIPIPKSPLKMKEWVDKISKPYNEKLTKQAEIKQLEASIQERINEIGLKEECEEVELGSICEYIKSGKAVNKEDRTGNLYPYYAANGICGYMNDYLFDGKFIICAQDGSIGATYLVNCKFYASNHVWVLKINTINPYMLFIILKYKVDYKIITSGSVIPKLTKENLSKIKISLPKNKQLIQDLEPTFQRIEKLHDEVKVAESLYKTLIKELSLEALPQQAVEEVLPDEKSDVKSNPPSEISEVKSNPPSEASVGGCPYIPSRGKNKGIHCGIKSKNGNIYCSTHSKLSSSSTNV